MIESIRNKLESINNYVQNSNGLDFLIRDYDGYKLSLVGSFDLCYYHEIEIIFYEIFKISMETSFKVDYIQCETPVQAQFQCCLRSYNEGLIEVFIEDVCGRKQSIVCEGIDFIIERVSYYDKTGKRIT